MLLVNQFCDLLVALDFAVVQRREQYVFEICNSSFGDSVHCAQLWCAFLVYYFVHQVDYFHLIPAFVLVFRLVQPLLWNWSFLPANV